MDKRYQPAQTEEKITRFWEKGKFFTPKIIAHKKPFVVTLPPPNVTGSLHAGHALYVIEDIVARYHRLKGEPTLFLPGFDHASIAVEHLVTKQLKKEGLDKRKIGRTAFLKRARQFANDSRKYIKKQLKTLGLSLDWTREAYTLDKKRARAVKEAFQRLYKENLIYQGERIINWCPHCQTVISNLENTHQEEKGKLYYIKYGPITIATTRPETMFADTAVAIHPKNKKYRHLVGKKVPLPLTKRKIPVIADQDVDPNFGTGALKITPAHDPVDFAIGQRHNLKAIQVIDKKGRLTKVAGPYAGLTVPVAREKVVQDLEKKGYLIKTETIVHAVGRCSRCGQITEPLISKQWFVKTKPLAKKAIAAVKSGQIKIIPSHFKKVYFHWLDNIEDWCISRQLWWGHKIPLPGEKDTLDTWFSSSLWPIATLGWPEEKNKDFQYFYPTTLRETGYDILFFWVAREIMMCLKLTGKVPFRIVYLHGLIRDKQHRKFSKSKNIGFDPLPIIKEHGSDALRMALVYGNSAGKDIVLSLDKVRAMRNFANKIWNASRFILMNRENKNLNPAAIKAKNKKENKDDKQIIKLLNKTIKTVTKHIENYRFGQAAEEIYQFFWHDFCDQYIENSKSHFSESYPTLLRVLKTSLILLHPFMPFITEEIWTYQLKEKTPLAITPWPEKISV